MKFDVIIIGGGPAGLTAALYLIRNGYSVGIVEKEFVTGGQVLKTEHLENFPTILDISGMDFTDRLMQQIEDKVQIFYGENVFEIYKNENAFFVKTDQNIFESRAVIIANGVKPRPLGLEHEEELTGKGVYYCATCDGPLFKDKETVLIGDGPSAMQYALQLAKYSKKVTIYTLFDRLFGEKSVIDEVESNKKIYIMHNKEAKELIRDGDKLVGIKFNDNIVKTDNVFVAIGRLPNNELFKNLVDLRNGFILTNNNMETKTPLLYAIGDTRDKDCKQVVSACSDGATAAIDISKKLH